jgi:hypothetical protein
MLNYLYLCILALKVIYIKFLNLLNLPKLKLQILSLLLIIS